MADRALRDVQLFARQAEAQAPGRGLEGAQGNQGGQGSRGAHGGMTDGWGRNEAGGCASCYARLAQMQKPATWVAGSSRVLRVLRNLGSPSWARTSDLRINSPSLYRLSYRGTGRGANYAQIFRGMQNGAEKACSWLCATASRQARGAWREPGRPGSARCALIVTRRGWRVSLRHWRRQRDEIVSMSPLDYVEPVIHVDGA